MLQYGVLGNPISHSMSPDIHKMFAQNCGIELSYKPYLIGLETFDQELSLLVEQGLKGCNVTLPFKENAYHYCDVVTKEAEFAKAVNTLTFKDNKVYGHNTDGYGFLSDMLLRQGIQVKNKRVLVLGAGGATRGVLELIVAEEPSELVVTNRTFDRADILVKFVRQKGAVVACEWDQADGYFDVIINATSASLNGNDITLSCEIDGDTKGYDLMYSANQTPFMEYLLKRGAGYVCDGFGMLVEQAALSFEVWHGVKPNTDAVYNILNEKLHNAVRI